MVTCQKKIPKNTFVRKFVIENHLENRQKKIVKVPKTIQTLKSLHFFCQDESGFLEASLVWQADREL